VPATGGTPVKLNGPLTTGGNVSSDGLQFSPDGQTVLYRAKPGFFDPTELFIVPSTGGTPVKLNGSLVNGGNVTSLGLQFSPDGSRVLYRADQDMDEVFEIYSRVVRQHWNGNVGDWNVAANWDQLQTPDEAMRIVIDQPAVVTLPTGAPDAMVGELSIGGGAGISTLRLEAGTTLSAVNGLTVLSGGIIRGEGAIQAEVTVEPGGMLAPGFSQGILEIDRLTMYTNSMLEIEIAGRDAELEYDQLLVGHEATLEGMLSVALLSSFTPAPNDTFTILTSANLAGSFANAANGSRLNTSGGDGSFLVNYNAETNNVTLSDFMSSLSLMGDYNRDNVIDAADYTVWRDALTAGGTSLPNDPTPGTVDESDFLYWREHFGESLGSGAGGGSPAAVPEPTALVLALIAWTGLLYWADARRRLAV